jgi:hypothetical protein
MSVDVGGSEGPLPIGRVGLLFEEPGAEQLVDPALEGGPPIIGALDRARQGDEPGPDVLVALAPADLVLDLPEGLVDGLRLGRSPRQLSN